MAQNVYSPKDVDIAVAGTNIDGWDSITINRNTENTTTHISADGKPKQTYSADTTGTVELEVQQQNSPVNSFFAAVQQGQDLAQNIAYFGITVLDKSGGVLVEMRDAFLNNPAAQDLAGEQTNRTWMLYVNDLRYLPNPAGTEGLEGVAQALSAADTILSNVKNLV